MPTRLSLWCDRLIEAGWLAALLLVPLFFQTSTARIFEPDKMVLVRLIALVMAVAWVVRMIDTRLARGQTAPDFVDDEPGFWRRVSPLIWPTLVTLAATVLATGASIALRASLFGAYQRGQGFISVAAFLTIFVLTLAYLRRRDQVDRAVTVILLASVPVTLFAVLQWFGVGPGVFSGLYAGRAFSSLGNPIFLGGYLIMVLPLTLIRVLRPGAGSLRALYATLLILQLIALLMTLSLGAWVAFVVAAGVFALAAVALRGRRGAILGVAVLAPLVVLGVVLVLNSAPVRDELATGPVALRRITRLFDAGDRSTLRVRMLIWEGAARAMGVDPVRAPFGFGPETNLIALSANVSPTLRYLGDADKNPDRSHNENWDRLIETGALGLLGYVWLVIAAIYLIVRRLGLVASRDRFWTFVGLSVGGAALGGLLPVLAGASLYLGIGVAAGLLLGVWVFLATAALSRPAVNDLTDEGRWLLVALLAAIAGHFIEVNIGPSDPTRRLMFWVFVALAGVVGARMSLLTAKPLLPYRPTPGLAYGALAGLALATMVYTFVPLDGFVLAANGFGVVWLTLLSLLVGGMLLWNESAREAGVVGEARPSWLPVLGGAVVGLAAMLVLRGAVLLAGGDAYSLLWAYLLALLVGLLLIATWLPAATSPAGRSSPLAWAAYLPLSLVALAATALVIVAPIQADMYARTAQAYLEAGDATTALRLAGRAVAAQPNEPVYAQKLGEWLASAAPLAATTQDRDSLYAQAVDSFGLAAQQWPNYGDYQYNIGHTYLLWAQQVQDQNQRQQLLAAAFQSLQNAALLDPNEPDNLVEAAQAALLANESPANIQALLLQALTVDPRNVQAYVLLGRLYLAQGQGPAAERALLNAAQLNPKGAQAAAVYNALGDYYQRTNRLPEAIEAVKKVADLAPDNYTPYLNLAGLYQRANRMPEALQAAQQALNLAPADARQRITDLIRQIQSGTRPTP